jgi:dipeptidyl aminopeptidase/acylaminoacyl peptidase
MTDPLSVRWQRLCFVVVACITSAFSDAQSKQPLTPQACTGVQYVAALGVTDRPRIQLSSDGRKVAYVVQVADVAGNNNEEELYVSPFIPQTSKATGPVLTSQLVTAIRWFPDDRHLALLLSHGQKIVLAQADAATMAQEIIWEADGDITDYSMDAAGNTIAVAVRIGAGGQSATSMAGDGAKGYRIDRASVAHSESPRRRIYVLHRIDEHHWKASEPISFVSPLSGKTIRDIVDSHDRHIDLSPDGRLLLMDNTESFSEIPKGSSWDHSAAVQSMRTRGLSGLDVNYLYDLATGRVSMPLDSPYFLGGLWAPDSKSYVKLALAPAASSWERADLREGTPNVHITHLFSVDVDTGSVSEVLNRAEGPPVAWKKSGDIVVRDPAGTLTTMRKISNQWKAIETKSVLPGGAAPYDSIASDGESVVMQYQDPGTPPQIRAVELKSGRQWTVANLNPEVDGFLLPKTQPFNWTTTTGYTAKGLLLLPPDYDPKYRYPLVVESGSILYNGQFVCDSGISHVPSFTRGILADAGIIYLMRNWPGIDDWKTNYYPKGYPGGIAEAAFQQDLTESAVTALDRLKMIDPAKVGLIGFSRGGWYVDYMLVHSRIPFLVASTTDNVLYSMGEYWYWNTETVARERDGLYGGPPYGESLKNWLEYSISFNLDKIHTPVLMEVMGDGKKYESPDSPPDKLAVTNEVFVGLGQLRKPVEYYYYPNEIHQPEHPQARIASEQRNVDWFRFWLQGYERPNPEDPDQYRRWERLRAQEVSDINRRAPSSSQVQRLQ